MGEVFKKEKSQKLFKAVITQQNVAMGPLATVEHHHPVKEGEKSNNKDEIDSERDDTIKMAPSPASISPKESQLQRRDVVRSASTQFGQRILLWLVTLPLNFIPVVGPLAFCYINGKARMSDVHRRYFDMKDMTLDERQEWIDKRHDDYRTFAFVCQALELVPVLGIVFGFTNTIGYVLQLQLINSFSID
jgi:hypothetical protein